MDSLNVLSEPKNYLQHNVGYVIKYYSSVHGFCVSPNPLPHLFSQDLNCFANRHKYKKNKVGNWGGLGESREEIKPEIKLTAENSYESCTFGL